MMNELPSTAMGVIRQLSVSKAGIQTFSKQLIDSVKNGEVNALELKAFFRALEVIIKKVDEETKENQVNALQNYSEKRFEAFGIEFEKCEVGIVYDYKVCCDPVYERLEVDLATTAEQLDNRKKFLRLLKEPCQILTGDGEVITLRPPLKKATDGFKTYIK